METLPRNLTQQRRRLRRVMEHIGQHLDRELTLAALAEVACWSPEHFDRMYRRSIGEPPMATLRRLRLLAAARSLAAGLPLVKAAQGAGYGSTQAFGRAFERQHGMLPSAWLRHASAAPASPPLAVVRLDEAVPCHRLAYRGDAAGVSALFDVTVERLQRSGSPRSQWQVFGQAPADAPLGSWGCAGGLCEMQAVVLAPPLAVSPAGMEAATVAAGWYARIPAAQATQRHWDDCLADAGWQRTEGAVLRHFDTDPAHTAPQERREWLYLPLARR
ncbi:AraC family transcriptional regulator [Piscinibacter sp. XHJ-5]|uniref:AraC family transcriptional regulator n=1 Tax=Piscinibacter sp. XHJ-5 TaxID=3037797 RepID=UPI002452D694|nr:AraC family transcriptional regulator [Piscinibacter sp. XHJ-5]